MADDWLFDPSLYGEGTTRQNHRASSGLIEPEPFTAPWVLLANRSGVFGFHIPQAKNQYGSTIALCGRTGHEVSPPETMVRCAECVEELGRK